MHTRRPEEATPFDVSGFEGLGEVHQSEWTHRELRISSATRCQPLDACFSTINATVFTLKQCLRNSCDG